MPTTKAGAPRTVLGRGGSKLRTIAKPLVLEGKKPAAIDAATKAFLPWLDAHASKELRAWNTLASTCRLRGAYRGAFTVARAFSFRHAVAGVEDDGCWVARVRSVFCAVSPILEEDEEMHLATWWSSPSGEARVYYTHQDEDELQSPSGSIASFLVGRYEHAFEEPLPVDATWKRASKAIDREKQKIPAHLDPVKLSDRVEWVKGLFLFVGDRKIFDDGWDTLPKLSAWKKEEELAKDWPHLQAYWLLHHLVLDNREELPKLLAMAERRYPAVKELAGWAERVLAGKPIQSPIWNEARVLGFRATALEQGLPVLTKEAAARARGTAKASPDAERAAKAAREALRKEPSTRIVLDTFGVGEAFAGEVPKLEQTLGQNLDEDLRMKVFMWSRRGNATALRSFLYSLTEKVDERFRPVFEPIVRGGAKLDEAHAKNVPGALAGLGAAIGEWSAFVAFVREVLGEPDALGRLRRLEIAVAGQRLLERGKAGDDAIAFLCREAKRWVDQIDAFQVDTAVTSLAFLLRRKDREAVELFNRMFARARYSGANWTSLIAFLPIAMDELRDPALLPGLRAAAKRGLGRHDDGDRALVWRALAACGEAPEAIEALASEVKDVRATCERAAVVAGLLQAGGDDYAAEAREALGRLVGDLGSMELGAAIGMLQAAESRGVKGFGRDVAAVVAAAKKDRFSPKLRGWLEAHASALA